MLFQVLKHVHFTCLNQGKISTVTQDKILNIIFVLKIMCKVVPTSNHKTETVLNSYFPQLKYIANFNLVYASGVNLC